MLGFKGKRKNKKYSNNSQVKEKYFTKIKTRI
jgi:hypothetical protein